MQQMRVPTEDLPSIDCLEDADNDNVLLAENAFYQLSPV